MISLLNRLGPLNVYVISEDDTVCVISDRRPQNLYRSPQNMKFTVAINAIAASVFTLSISAFGIVTSQSGERAPDEPRE